MKAIMKAVRKAVRNVVARYEVDAYDGYMQWGSHKCITKQEALEWMAQYPKGAMVVVWNRRMQIVAQRREVLGVN